MQRTLSRFYCYKLSILPTTYFFELFRSSNKSLEVVTFQIRKTNYFRLEIRRRSRDNLRLSLYSFHVASTAALIDTLTKRVKPL